MITCENCGKKTGQGATGHNWICEDCKVSPEQETSESTHSEKKADPSTE